MMKSNLDEGYGPNKKSASVSGECEFHLRGCCFDPKKTVEGFFAAPCFDCTSIIDTEEHSNDVEEQYD